MEAAILGGILGLGYYFSNADENTRIQHTNALKQNKTKSVRFSKTTKDGEESKEDGNMQRSLTGNLLPTNAFHHNNMVPFFGSTVKQNVDADANHSILDNYVGAGSVDYAKQESMQFFNREQNNIGTPFGAESNTDKRQEKIKAAKIRNNELPFEQIRVGPGLDDGYTNIPSGGVQQMKSRDAALLRYKSIDELRTKNDQKITYHGVMMNPQAHIKTHAFPGEVRHYHPDRFYVNNNGERNLVGKNAYYEAQRVMPEVVDRDVARPETTKEYFGTGVYVDAARSYNIPQQREAHKQQLGTMNVGPAALAEGGNNGSYGREGYVALPNQRTQTGARNAERMGPMGEQRGGQVPLLYQDGARFNKKMMFQGNGRSYGNKGMNYPGALPANDPNDIARRTIREQTEDNDYVAPPQTDVAREQDYS